MKNCTASPVNIQEKCVDAFVFQVLKPFSRQRSFEKKFLPSREPAVNRTRLFQVRTRMNGRERTEKMQCERAREIKKAKWEGRVKMGDKEHWYGKREFVL